MKRFIKEKSIELVGNSDTPLQIAQRAILIEFGNLILEEIKERLNKVNQGYGYTGCSCKDILEE